MRECIEDCLLVANLLFGCSAKCFHQIRLKDGVLFGDFLVGLGNSVREGFCHSRTQFLGGCGCIKVIIEFELGGFLVGIGVHGILDGHELQGCLDLAIGAFSEELFLLQFLI